MAIMSNQLKKIRTQKGVTQEALAELVNTSHATIQRLESGGIKFTLDWAERLAPSLGVHPANLLFDAPNLIIAEQTSENAAEPVSVPLEPIPIKGMVETGRAAPAIHFPPNEWYYISLPIDDRYPGLNRHCLKVDDHSLNLAFAPGSLIICIDMTDIGYQLEDGATYVIDQTGPDGGTLSSLRELRIETDGRKFLWPKTSDPQAQTPVPLADQDGKTRAGGGSSTNGNNSAVKTDNAIYLRARVIGEYSIR